MDFFDIMRGMNFNLIGFAKRGGCFNNDMPDLGPIAFITGPTDNGWSKFSVRLGNQSWFCKASYIGSNPLLGLIHSAVDIYDHIFVNPLSTDDAVWFVDIMDEPGGISIRAVPEERTDKVTISVFEFKNEDFPSPDQFPGHQPAGQELVGYWDYASAVFQDAARAIIRQGITGFRRGWAGDRWDVDGHFEILPFEHFLFLAALVRYREPVHGMTLNDEIDLLKWIKERFEHKQG